MCISANIKTVRPKLKSTNAASFNVRIWELYKKVNNRLNLGTASYDYVQNIFFSSLLSIHIYFEIYKTMILTYLLFYIAVKHVFLTSRKEDNLRLYENRLPRIIFGPERDEIIGGGI